MKNKSYVPEKVGAAHMNAIAHRYPYPFPPALQKGPHPTIGGVPTPGGKAYTGRQARRVSGE